MINHNYISHRYRFTAILSGIAFSVILALPSPAPAAASPSEESRISNTNSADSSGDGKTNLGDRFHATADIDPEASGIKTDESSMPEPIGGENESIPSLISDEALSGDLSPEKYLLADMPIVLLATRLPQPVSETPASMSIISRQTIKASGALTIPDVLRLVPGFQVSLISGINHSPQYHGLGDEHPKQMQVLVDGRSIYHAAHGGVQWDAIGITLADVEKIEIVRGPNPSSYGANAFMGVINIVTRKAADELGHTLIATTGYGNTHELEWRYGAQLGDLALRMTMNYLETDGFPTHFNGRDFSNPGGLPEISYPRLDDHEWSRFNLRADYAFENGDNLLVQFGYSNNDKTNGNAVPNQLGQNGHSENLESNFQHIRWFREEKDNSYQLSFYHNQLHEEDITTEYFNAVWGVLTGGHTYTVDRYHLEYEHTSTLRDDWRMVWGVNGRVDTLESYNAVIDNKDHSRFQTGVFVNTENHLSDRVILNGGLMLEYHENIGANLSPRLGLNIRLDDQNALRIVASQAFRMPALLEQHRYTKVWQAANPAVMQKYFDDSNALSISPERLTTYEIGILSNHPNNKSSVDVRLFHEQIRDYIDGVDWDCPVSPDCAAGADYEVHENAGWMDISGAELQASIKLSEKTNLKYSASLTKAAGRRIKDRDATGNATVYDTMSDFVPNVTVSALLSHRFGNGIEGSVAYYHLSEMEWPSDGTTLPSYDRFDLRAAKSIKINGSEVTGEVLLQNFTGGDYYEFSKYNRFEPRSYFRVTVDF